VHCVASLQDLLDAEWHAAALEKFSSLYPGHDEQLACLTELISVTAGAVGIRSFYLATGQSVPAVPAAKGGSVHFSSVAEFCKGGLETTSYAWGPQVMKAQIVASGLEKIGLSLPDWVDNTNPMSPYSKLTPTPFSMSLQHAWMQTMYIPPQNVLKLFAKVPDGRNLGRSGMELVAGSYSGSVSCSF